METVVGIGFSAAVFWKRNRIVDIGFTTMTKIEFSLKAYMEQLFLEYEGAYFYVHKTKSTVTKLPKSFQYMIVFGMLLKYFPQASEENIVWGNTRGKQILISLKLYWNVLKINMLFSMFIPNNPRFPKFILVWTNMFSENFINCNRLLQSSHITSLFHLLKGIYSVDTAGGNIHYILCFPYQLRFGNPSKSVLIQLIGRKSIMKTPWVYWSLKTIWATI